MLFFDFLYLSIYKFYLENGEKSADSTSATIVGGLQAANILTVIFWGLFLANRSHAVNKLWGVAIAVLFQVTSYIRYIYKENHSIQSIEMKWEGKTEPFRKTVHSLLILYIIVSIVSFFGLAIYIGGKNNP